MHINEKTNNKVSELINLVVASHFNIGIDFILSKSHKSETMAPRQIAIYLHKKFTKLTLVEIGSVFSFKDHSTIKYSINRVANLSETEPQYRKRLKVIESELKKMIQSCSEPNANTFFYTIDLNHFQSTRFENEKAIITKGFDESEINEINSFIESLQNKKQDSKNHENTGIFIFEKI